MMQSPSSPVVQRGGRGVQPSPSRTRPQRSSFMDNLSSSAPSTPAKLSRTKGFVARSSIEPTSDFAARMQQVTATQPRPANRDAYSARVKGEMYNASQQQQQPLEGRIAPGTDASRGVGVGRRSQSDNVQRQSSQQQRYAGLPHPQQQLEPPYEDDSQRSFRRTVSANVRSVSQSRPGNGQRLRQSIFTTDGRLNEASLEDRCANLESNANGVLQFYNGIVQDGVGPRTIDEMLRHWQPFEVYKTNQLMASSSFHQHFINASEVQASHQLQSAPDYFTSAITRANRATFVHYIWGIPDDCTLEELQQGTYQHRALPQLMETKRVFVTWIVPPDVPIDDDVLALYLDLCTQLYIASRFADYKLPLALRRRAKDHLDTALSPEALRAALFRAKKLRELSSRDIDGIVRRYQSFVEARLRQAEAMDRDPNLMAQEWPLRSTGADLCAYVTHIDSSNEFPPHCSSSLQALLDELEPADRSQLPDASRELLEGSVNSEGEGSRFEYEVQQAPRQSTPAQEKVEQESYHATETQQNKWLEEHDDTKEAELFEGEGDDQAGLSNDASVSRLLQPTERLDVLAAIMRHEDRHTSAAEIEARLSESRAASAAASAAVTPRALARTRDNGASATPVGAAIMEEIRLASIKRSTAGPSGQAEKRRRVAEEQRQTTPTPTAPHERLVFDSQKRLKKTTEAAPLGKFSREATGKGERLERFDENEEEEDIFLEQQQQVLSKRGKGNARNEIARPAKIDKGKARAIDPPTPTPEPEPTRRTTRAAARSQSREASVAPVASGANGQRLTRAQLRTTRGTSEAAHTEDEQDTTAARKPVGRRAKPNERRLEPVEEDEDRPMPDMDEAPDFGNMDFEQDFEPEVARAASPLNIARAPRGSRTDEGRIPAASAFDDAPPPNNQQALSDSGLYSPVRRHASNSNVGEDEDEEMEYSQAELDRQAAAASALRKRKSNVRAGFLNIRPPRPMDYDDDEEQVTPRTASQPGSTRRALLEYGDPERSGPAAESLKQLDQLLVGARFKLGALGHVAQRSKEVQEKAAFKQAELHRVTEKTKRLEQRLEEREERRTQRRLAHQKRREEEGNDVELSDTDDEEEIEEESDEEDHPPSRTVMGRQVWTEEEVQVLLRALDKHAKRKLFRDSFQTYVAILKDHGMPSEQEPNKGGDGQLSRWTNQQLKDKAKNILEALYRQGKDMPYWKPLLFPRLNTPRWPERIEQHLSREEIDELRRRGAKLDRFYLEPRKLKLTATRKSREGIKKVRVARRGEQDEEEEEDDEEYRQDPEEDEDADAASQAEAELEAAARKEAEEDAERSNEEQDQLEDEQSQPEGGEEEAGPSEPKRRKPLPRASAKKARAAVVAQSQAQQAQSSSKSRSKTRSQTNKVRDAAKQSQSNAREDVEREEQSAEAAETQL